jgi:hypothetical protein
MLDILILAAGASLLVGTVKVVEQVGGYGRDFLADCFKDLGCELRAAVGALFSSAPENHDLPVDKRQAFGINVDKLSPPTLNVRNADTLKYLARTVQLYAETERKVDDAVEALETAWDDDMKDNVEAIYLPLAVGRFLDEYDAIKKPTIKPVRSVQEAVAEFHRQQAQKARL